MSALELYRRAADADAHNLAVFEFTRHTGQANHQVTDITIGHAAKCVRGDDVDHVRRIALAGQRRGLTLTVGRDGEGGELQHLRRKAHLHGRGLPGAHVD
jgi:hypothetical protein